LVVKTPRCIFQPLTPRGESNASRSTKSLFDVTEGSNFTPDTACGYLCSAEAGYDGPTGNGTPNGIGGF
jgi:hypothetical protein